MEQLDSVKSVTKQETTPAGDVKISRLLNSIQFYLECSFIVYLDKGYRLVIIHSGRVLMDAHYNTLRGAKIAFTKYFGRRAWQEETKPNWSHAYQPDSVWIEKYFNIVKKTQTKSD